MLTGDCEVDCVDGHTTSNRVRRFIDVGYGVGRSGVMMPHGHRSLRLWVGRWLVRVDVKLHYCRGDRR